MEESSPDWIPSDVDQPEAGSRGPSAEWAGKRPSKEQLDAILQAHETWVETEGAEGRRADLSQARLYRANLSGANLFGANLSGANLIFADLSGADLSGTDLYLAVLFSANLSRASLSSTNLSRADLSGADLTGADLSGANLSGADLSRANLAEADLRKAHDLAQATFTPDDLRGAMLPPSMERLLSMIPEEAEPGERTTSPGEASKATSEDPSPRPSAEAPDAAMSTTVDISRTLAPALHVLDADVRTRLDDLIQQISSLGLDGLSPDLARKLSQSEKPDASRSRGRSRPSGPTWMLRINDEYRAFVVEDDDRLLVTSVFPKERIEAFQS